MKIYDTKYDTTKNKRTFSILFFSIIVNAVHLAIAARADKLTALYRDLTQRLANALAQLHKHTQSSAGYVFKVFGVKDNVLLYGIYLFKYSHDTGNSKYVSGYGSSLSVKCHHSQSIGSKPFLTITLCSFIRFSNCSSVTAFESG